MIRYLDDLADCPVLVRPLSGLSVPNGYVRESDFFLSGEDETPGMNAGTILMVRLPASWSGFRPHGPASVLMARLPVGCLIMIIL
jgi:hypothetical protein